MKNVFLLVTGLAWRRDIQYNDSEPNDTQHNDTKPNDTQHNDTKHDDTQLNGLICDTH